MSNVLEQTQEQISGEPLGTDDKAVIELRDLVDRLDGGAKIHAGILYHSDDDGWVSSVRMPSGSDETCRTLRLSPDKIGELVVRVIKLWNKKDPSYEADSSSKAISLRDTTEIRITEEDEEKAIQFALRVLRSQIES